MNKTLILSLLLTVISARAQIIMSNGTVFSGSVSGGYNFVATGKKCALQVVGGTNPVQCTWSAAPSVGESIFCGVATFGAATFAVTDSVPNTYSANGSIFSGSVSNGHYQLYAAYGITGSPTTSKVTITGTANYGVISCASFKSGTAADGAVGTGTTVGGASVSATINPTLQSDLAYCFVAVTGTRTISAGPGFILTATAVPNVTSEYGFLASSGSQTASAKMDGNASMDMICGTYE